MYNHELESKTMALILKEENMALFFLYIATVNITITNLPFCVTLSL